jgi:hypothetical protein
MPRVDRESFDDRTLVRVYIALKMAEARLVEEVLETHGFEYAVIVEPAGRTLFGSPRNGAVFCVAEEHGVRCAQALIQAGFPAGVVPQDQDDRE